jgi:radical SAM superfamily enzyme YgiQ (UPF0313 family)
MADYDILLVNPPVMIENKPEFEASGVIFLIDEIQISAINPGILSIDSYLKSHSINTKIIDLSNDNDYSALSEEMGNEPKMVGVSCNSAFSYMETLESLRVAKEVYPPTFTVAGGQHIGMLGKRIFMDTDDLDVLVTHEGEIPMLKLYGVCARNGIDLCDIKGIIFRDERGSMRETPLQTETVDINDMSPLDYESYPNFRDFTPYVEESRGCPYRCEFCTNYQMMRKVRTKRPEIFAEELERVIALWGSEPMYAILTSSFGVSYEDGLEKSRIIGKKGIKWTTEFRADSQLGEAFEELSENGLSVCNIGFESANEDILQTMRKTREPKAYIESMRRIAQKSSNIKDTILRVNFIFYPGETPRTLKDNIRFLIENPVDSVTYTPLVIYPGTEIESNFRRYEQDFGSEIKHTQFWDSRHAHLCKPSRFFSFEEMLYLCRSMEKLFSTDEAWVQSREYYYNQRDPEIHNRLTKSRYKLM